MHVLTFCLQPVAYTFKDMQGEKCRHLTNEGRQRCIEL